MANDWQRDQKTWATSDDRLQRCSKGQNHWQLFASSPSLDQSEKTLHHGELNNTPKAILQAKQRRRGYSELPGEGSIRHLSSLFAQEDHQPLVHRLPHFRRVNKPAFLLSNSLLAVLRNWNLSLQV